ncbi:MAG: ABC transporter substrate-binding protein [Hyphomicrobiaceae bacterium]
MIRKRQGNASPTDKRPTRRTFAAGAGAAGIVFASAPFGIVRSQTGPLKVGVILPRTGIQAESGQSCYQSAEVAPSILKQQGYPDLEIMPGDTESKVDVARATAERLINNGAQILVGAFDSGQTTAIAQVAEQRNIPLLINIAAAPAITEQGYKFVFRNFPTAGMIVTDSLLMQKELFAHTKTTPKKMVLMHVNDTYGTAVLGGIKALMPKHDMPFPLQDMIAYDPAARDLSVEVAKAKATGADLLWAISRVNDSILITREMVKQRWQPTGVIAAGPGWYEDQYLQTLGPIANDMISTVPWYDPTKPLSKTLIAAVEKAFPGRNVATNQAYTFEALLIVADAYKRSKSSDPKALADALRQTDIAGNVTVGTVKFNAKGQNEVLRCAAVQNRNGRLIVVAPRSAANGEPIWPIRPWDKKA